MQKTRRHPVTRVAPTVTSTSSDETKDGYVPATNYQGTNHHNSNAKFSTKFNSENAKNRKFSGDNLINIRNGLIRKHAKGRMLPNESYEDALVRFVEEGEEWASDIMKKYPSELSVKLKNRKAEEQGKTTKKGSTFFPKKK